MAVLLKQKKNYSNQSPLARWTCVYHYVERSYRIHQADILKLSQTLL